MSIVDVVITAGQSQMSGTPGNGTYGGSLAPNTNPALAWDYKTGPGFVTVDDPGSSAAPYNAQTGSPVPAFCNTFTDVTGRPLLVVRAAVGGTSLLAANASTNGSWDVGGVRFTASVTRYQAAVDYLVNTLGHTIGNVFVIWSQGFRDALGGQDLETYGEVNAELVNRWRIALGQPNLQMYMEEMYDVSGYGATVSARCIQIRDEQRAAVLAHDGLHIAFTIGSTYKAKGWVAADQLHYDQRGLNEMGDIFAKYVLADLAYEEPEPEPVDSEVTSRIGHRALGLPFYLPPAGSSAPEYVPAVFKAVAYNSVSGAGSLVFTRPPTLAVDDLMLATCISGAAATQTALQAGWLPIGVIGLGGTFWKLATVSDVIASNFSFDSSANTSTHRGVLAVFSGADPTAPIAASGAAQVTTNGSSPSIAAALPKTLLYSVLMNAGSNTTTLVTVPVTMFEIFKTGATAFRSGATEIVEAGPTGAKQWTNPNGTHYVGSFAINPKLAA